MGVKMRILFVSHLFPYLANPVFGIFTQRQIETFVKLGADITLLFPQVWVPGILGMLKSKWRNYAQKHKAVTCEGVKIVGVNYPRYSSGFGAYRWDGLMVYHAAKSKAKQLHKHQPFDVVYGKGIMPSADVAVRLGKFLKIPAVGEGIGSDVHVVPDYSLAMYKHFEWICRSLAGAVADGKGVADRLSSVMGMDVPTVHGLVSMEEFNSTEDNRSQYRRKNGLALDKLIVLFVGSLKKEKGIYELVDAFTKVHEILPNVELKMCGQGAHIINLRQNISDKNAGEYVEIIGPVAPEDMHGWMKACDLFVLPSYTEGMPNVVMEAMATKRAVVATAVGGLPVAVGDCDGVILVEPKNVSQLADAMQRVLSDESLRQKMQLAARKTAQEKFSIEKNCQKVLDYLTEIIQRY